jgi:cyclic beta-1,2-glucan synthetase
VCQIDSIAQSWAVLSGAGAPGRSLQAVTSAASRLIREDDQVALLLAPPFDQSSREVGYIAAYPPGIRENGGQYTHAGLWLAWAFADLGQGDRAEALFRLLNPIYHANTPDRVARYRSEPYVVAADICGLPPHTGRGGWTWYTGSAAWMYRLGLERILGLQRAGAALRFDPCIPADWPGYDVTYQAGPSRYDIAVENPGNVSRGVRQVTLDGSVLPNADIPLLQDGERHVVRVVMG